MTLDYSTEAAQYHDRVLNALDTYPNPGVKARALTEELEELPKVIAKLARERREIISEMRRGGQSAQSIADAMGMSRARVYELLRGSGSD